VTGAPSDSYVGGLFHTASAGNMARSYKAKKRAANRPLQHKPRAKKPRQSATPQMDIFAEHLANGLSPGDAAVAMGRPREKGHVYLNRLRKRLGPQAV
jgi:hypothetical protein